MQGPRLRDGRRLTTHELYPLNIFPEEVIERIAQYITYLVCIGRSDITGDDWGDAFAYATGGEHLASPVGIADVVLGRCCWSVKTVKAPNPFNLSSVRLISGRNSPDFSYGITDPRADIQKTGNAVLGIWNERVNIAMDHYSQVRTAVLIRSYDLTEFVLFEDDTTHYRINDYHWEENRNGNLIGIDSRGQQCFTWQPHGSQFTIHVPVPVEAVRFHITFPQDRMGVEQVLRAVSYSNSMLKIMHEHED